MLFYQIADTKYKKRTGKDKIIKKRKIYLKKTGKIALDKGTIMRVKADRRSADIRERRYRKWLWQK